MDTKEFELLLEETKRMFFDSLYETIEATGSVGDVFNIEDESYVLE